MLCNRPYKSKAKLSHEQILTIATYCQAFGVNDASKAVGMNRKTVSSIKRGVNYKGLASLFTEVKKHRPHRKNPAYTGILTKEYRNVKQTRYGTYIWRMKIDKFEYVGKARATPQEAYQEFLLIYKEWYGVLPSQVRKDSNSFS